MCWLLEGFIIKNFLNTANLGSRSGKPDKENIDLQPFCCSEAKTLTDLHPQMGFIGFSQILALETPVLPLKPLRQPLQPLCWPGEGCVTLEWVTQTLCYP